MQQSIDFGGQFGSHTFVGVDDQHPGVGRLRDGPVLEVARVDVLALDDPAAADRATMSSVPSVEPESATSTSSATRWADTMQGRMFFRSFLQGMMTVSFCFIVESQALPGLAGREALSLRGAVSLVVRWPGL